MKTILVVDDDPNARSVLKDMLAAEGYNVLEAMDGIEALAVLGRETVHLVITDRTMPGMDGLVLLKKLQEKKVTLPILMISAYGEEKLWSEAIRLGALDYIMKPFNIHQVLRLIKKHLAGEKR